MLLPGKPPSLNWESSALSRAPQGASAGVRFLCPLAGAPGASLVRRSFFCGALMTSTTILDVADLPPLPMRLDVWTAIVRKLHFGPRETQIVELILRRQQQKAIAQRLGIKPCTVQTYLQRVYNRLRVSDQHALVLRIFAESHGLGPACE
jgi:DNA-binding CsgD family transcriptional regulator